MIGLPEGLSIDSIHEVVDRDIFDIKISSLEDVKGFTFSVPEAHVIPCIPFVDTEDVINKPKTPVTKLDKQDRSYVFPGGDEICLFNVVELIVSESGNHRLKTSDRGLHIVAPGWLHISIAKESGEWSL